MLYADFGNRRVLLTSDAGINAQRWACDHADSIGIDLLQAGIVQVPHHGSRRNASPTVLDRMIGPRLPIGSPPRRWAVVSAPKDDAKHPRKIVVNAYTRRGAPVQATQGQWIRFYDGMQPRGNESQAPVLPLYSQVESYD